MRQSKTLYDCASDDGSWTLTDVDVLAVTTKRETVLALSTHSPILSVVTRSCFAGSHFYFHRGRRVLSNGSLSNTSYWQGLSAAWCVLATE